MVILCISQLVSLITVDIPTVQHCFPIELSQPANDLTITNASCTLRVLAVEPSHGGNSLGLRAVVFCSRCRRATNFRECKCIALLSGFLHSAAQCNT